MAAGTKRTAIALAEEINTTDASDEAILRDVVGARKLRHHFLMQTSWVLSLSVALARPPLHVCLLVPYLL